VQRDERVGHDRAARVVEGLREVALPQGVAHVRVAGQDDALVEPRRAHRTSAAPRQ
jgi:hypothetical protein